MSASPIPVGAEMLRRSLHLPDGVSIVGASMDLSRDVVTLWVVGAPYDGELLSPTFTREDAMVRLSDWGVETR